MAKIAPDRRKGTRTSLRRIAPSLAAQDGLIEAGKGLLSALGFAEFDVLDSHNIPFPKPTVEVAVKKLQAALASIEVKS